MIHDLLRGADFEQYAAKLVLACAPDDHYIIKYFNWFIQYYNKALHATTLYEHASALISQGADCTVYNGLSPMFRYQKYRQHYPHVVVDIIRLYILLSRNTQGFPISRSIRDIALTMVCLAHEMDIDDIYIELREYIPSNTCNILIGDKIIATYVTFDAYLLYAALHHNGGKSDHPILEFRYFMNLNLDVPDADGFIRMGELRPVPKSPLINALLCDFSERYHAYKK